MVVALFRQESHGVHKGYILQIAFEREGFFNRQVRAVTA